MKDIIYKILWSTIEDYVGLWEISWELNSLLPKFSNTENREIAKKILKYLLERQLIILYSDKWGRDELKEVQSNDIAMQFLEKERYWNAPALDEMCIKIGNTDKGEICYNRDLLGDFVLGST